MKKSLLLAGLLLTTTGSFAATEQFVGLDLLKGSVSTSNSATGTISRISTNQSLSGSYTEGNTLKDTSYQFKIGAVLDDSSRVYFSHLSLSDTLYDETYKYSLNAINYDYFIKNDQLNGFIPYVGGHIGYGKTTFSDMMPSVSSMDYGYNIGILKNIKENTDSISPNKNL